LTPEVAETIKAAVRALPPLPEERLDRIASLFARMDADAREARVRARLRGGGGS
jgi:hypothetical protein